MQKSQAYIVSGVVVLPLIQGEQRNLIMITVNLQCAENLSAQYVLQDGEYKFKKKNVLKEKHCKKH